MSESTGAPVGGSSSDSTLNKPTLKKKHDKRLLIYGGIALAFLLIFIFARIKGSGGTSGTAFTDKTVNTPTDPNGLSSQDIVTIENQLAGFTADLAKFKTDEATRNASVDDSIAKQTGVLANIGITLNDAIGKITQIGTGSGLTDTSGAAGIAPDAIQGMMRNGEFIVDSVKSTTGGWLYLTNKGGVYNSGGSQHFGSYLGYASTTKNPNQEIADHGNFGTGGLAAIAGGHYTLRNTKGETYTF